MNEISKRKFKVCQNVLKKCPKRKKTFSVCGAAAFGKETHPVSYVVYSHHVLSSFYDLGNTLGQNKHIWFFLFVFELFLEINTIIEIQIYNIMIIQNLDQTTMSNPNRMTMAPIVRGSCTAIFAISL